MDKREWEKRRVHTRFLLMEDILHLPQVVFVLCMGVGVGGD